MGGKAKMILQGGGLIRADKAHLFQAPPAPAKALLPTICGACYEVLVDQAIPGVPDGEGVVAVYCSHQGVLCEATVSGGAAVGVALFGPISEAEARTWGQEE